MLINGQSYTPIWEHPQDRECIQIIDQRYLPHEFIIFDMRVVEDAATAIKEMLVRGAPLIGVTAAYGMYLACLKAKREGEKLEHLRSIGEMLKATRPTAVNLAWAVDLMLERLSSFSTPEDWVTESLKLCREIFNKEREDSRKIGEFGFGILEEISKRKNGEAVNILTHCNAGWLATVDFGTATAPMYEAQRQNLPIHVWVDETRPRNQGANLTAWELGENNIPHTLIVDNTGGHLMQHGMVDVVMVGTDRTTRCGDVANKIGTYLKALAAKDNGVPFYVALTSSAFDWKLRDGLREIPIEQRDQREVTHMRGRAGELVTDFLICPENCKAANYGFDVTPARLVDGLITERGICDANEESIIGLFPENR